jgi:predicted metalloprotease with PDZ domain
MQWRPNKELHFTPGAPIRISYVLVKDWKGPLDSGTRFRPDLSRDYFHIIVKTSLVHPALDPSSVVDVQFDWNNLPLEWSLATSFGTDDRCQTFHGMWRDAENSLFVGGDYRIYHTVVSNHVLHFAIRGKWSFSDDEWIRQVRKIIEFERTFWDDNDFPDFLVTLTPFDQDHGSSGGTALTNSFMEHLSRLDTLSSGTLAQLAHEIFHEWNPYRIGYLPGSNYTVSWFYEGFTRYYQDFILYRAGLMMFPDYVAAVNEKIRAYDVREGTDVTLQEFIRRHSADQSILDQLDSRRGAVIAAWLDATIRQQSRGRWSLDNLMFDLFKQNVTYRRNHTGKPMELNNQRVFRMVSKYIRSHSRKLLRQYVKKGGSIQVPENFLGPCVQSRAETAIKFDLGFARKSIDTETRMVTGVEPASEAWKAGLRDGQKLVGWSFSFGDTSKQVRLTVKTPNGEEVLKYFPRGRQVSVQRFILDPSQYSANRERCALE